MRVYNTKHFLKILFSLHKSDTLKILFPSMLLVGLYSWGIQYLEVEYLHLTSKSGISNVGMIHSLLGFVLSLCWYSEQTQLTTDGGKAENFGENW